MGSKYSIRRMTATGPKADLPAISEKGVFDAQPSPNFLVSHQVVAGRWRAKTCFLVGVRSFLLALTGVTTPTILFPHRRRSNRWHNAIHEHQHQSNAAFQAGTQGKSQCANGTRYLLPKRYWGNKELGTITEMAAYSCPQRQSTGDEGANGRIPQR